MATKAYIRYVSTSFTENILGKKYAVISLEVKFIPLQGPVEFITKTYNDFLANFKKIFEKNVKVFYSS